MKLTWAQFWKKDSLASQIAKERKCLCEGKCYDCRLYARVRKMMRQCNV